jgi:hypothetical protein
MGNEELMSPRRGRFGVGPADLQRQLCSQPSRQIGQLTQVGREESGLVLGRLAYPAQVSSRHDQQSSSG